MRFFLVLCSVFFFLTSSAFAQQISVEFKADEDAAIKFQQALKNDDKKAVANLIYYPLERDYPLTPIKTPEEFVTHWDEFFDAKFTNEVLAAKPEQIGWRGVQLVNGLVWFKDAKVYRIQYNTSTFEKIFEEAKEKEGQSINSEARGYTNLLLTCETKSKRIRVQRHGDVIRYFVWKKGDSLTEKPELNLVGDYLPDGNGGNGHYTFKNHDYSYVVEDFVLCEDPVCHKNLIINKNDTEISNQVCN
ncbi:MAG: hypothetical protein JNM12_00040 [Alphaproteobacteria bacterium]|nr:hypothetical protein [Alphaproteobacteria bacterium]